ncbi:MAG: hypothetical protein HBSAPP02_02020 [Phycisphaerae bacterium]|nr:MAG: hypothetical protein HBSAPP02_02020 [Phycisphaerae bacterium]
MARRGREVAGVLPLFKVESWLAGRLLVSVPYGVYGGVLASDADAAECLLAAGKRLADQMNARSVEFRSRTPLDNTLPVMSDHATFRRDLPGCESQLETFLPRKARAAARKATERHELSAEFGADHLDVVWELYARSMRRLGSVNYPKRFFHALAAHAGSGMIVQMVRYAGRPVAGLVSFVHRDEFMPYFVGFDDRVALYGVSQYLYLASMRWAVRNGCRVYDFGRSRVDNRGAYEFKRLCGFEPQPLGYQVYVPAGRTAPDLSAGSTKWQLARRAWKYLPLAVARPLGAWLSKSIPG